MDSDSDSSSNNEEPIAKRKINFLINFDIDNFEETCTRLCTHSRQNDTFQSKVKKVA